MSSSSIGFIGGGRVARILLGGLERAGLLIAVGLLAANGVWGAEPGFDVQVSSARKHMRASCTAVRKAMKATGAERRGLETMALAEVRAAEDAWRGIAREFATQIPAAYAGDPMWSARLHDFVLNTERMRVSIETGEYRSGFLACAHTCGLIGAMHEANGVFLPVDAMAALRKKVKVLKGLVTAGSPRAERVIPEVLRLRDRVLLTPAPPSGNREAYLQGLPGLSAAVDAVASTAREGESLQAVVQDLAATIEIIYEYSL